MPPFERAEYLERIARTKARMAERGIDLLLVSDPCNMNYLTGYDATSYYVHQIVALAIDADEPLWIGRAMDVACARFTTFLGAENMVGYPESYIGRADRHPSPRRFRRGDDRRADGHGDRSGVQIGARAQGALAISPRAADAPGRRLPDAGRGLSRRARRAARERAAARLRPQIRAIARKANSIGRNPSERRRICKA